MRSLHATVFLLILAITQTEETPSSYSGADGSAFQSRCRGSSERNQALLLNHPLQRHGYASIGPRKRLRSYDLLRVVNEDIIAKSLIEMERRALGRIVAISDK